MSRLPLATAINLSANAIDSGVNSVSVVPSRESSGRGSAPGYPAGHGLVLPSGAWTSLALNSKGKRFPRESRLLRHADFDLVYREGKRHFSSLMTVFYRPRAASGPQAAGTGLRIGLTVSKALGGAVDRNRMRRRMREAIRMVRPLIASDLDVVINPKKAVLKAEFATIAQEVMRAFETVLRKSASSGAISAATRSTATAIEKSSTNNS